MAPEDNRGNGRCAPHSREHLGMIELALPCFSTAPASTTDARGPGILLVHEGTGMSAQLIRVAERLAREGYRVVAPDFFSRSDGIDPDDFGAIIGSVTPEHLDAVFAAAADRLRADGATSIGITGFCMGGRFSYRAALQAEPVRHRGVSAVLRWRHRAGPRRAGVPDAALLRGIRSVHPDRRHRGRAGAPSRRDVVVYPDATHGFMRDGSDSYAPADAADAWSRTLAFFAEHLT